MVVILGVERKNLMPDLELKEEENVGLLDIDSLNDSESIEEAIAYHKTKLYEKSKFLSQTEQAKRDMAASFREQIKEIKEEVQFEMDQIGSLIDKQKILNASNGS